MANNLSCLDWVPSEDNIRSARMSWEDVRRIGKPLAQDAKKRLIYVAIGYLLLAIGFIFISVYLPKNPSALGFFSFLSSLLLAIGGFVGCFLTVINPLSDRDEDYWCSVLNNASPNFIFSNIKSIPFTNRDIVKKHVQKYLTEKKKEQNSLEVFCSSYNLFEIKAKIKEITVGIDKLEFYMGQLTNQDCKLQMHLQNFTADTDLCKKVRKVILDKKDEVGQTYNDVYMQRNEWLSKLDKLTADSSIFKQMYELSQLEVVLDNTDLLLAEAKAYLELVTESSLTLSQTVNALGATTEKVLTNVVS